MGMWVNPEQRKRMVDTLRRGGKVRGMEALMKATDGTIREAAVSVEGMTYEGRECIPPSYFDLSELRSLERKLVQREACLRSILERSSEGIAIIQEGRIA